MRLRIGTWLVVLLFAANGAGCARRGRGANAAPPAAATFVCADSLQRADGTQKNATCVLAREYCYEASGGAAFSHGAHCRPLPAPDARCADLATSPGSSCTGAPETGFIVKFAYP